jgi:hypothetical protein
MPSNPPSLAEQVELLAKWDAGEHPTVFASVHYHHHVHGGGTDLWEYLRAASAFNRAGAVRVPPTGTRPGGTVKFKHKNGEFLIERDGKILSYGPPGS